MTPLSYTSSSCRTEGFFSLLTPNLSPPAFPAYAQSSTCRGVL